MSAPLLRCGQLLMKMRVFTAFQKRFGSSLFSPSYLGISAFQKRRLEVKDTVGDYKDKFVTRMEEEASKPGQKIFACDIISLIELADTDEHIDLLTILIKKYGENLKSDPLQTQSSIGPQLLRLMYTMDKVDLAYSLFFDQYSNVAPWFRKIVCFQILMDMLYKAERYDDVVNLFPHAQELFKRDSSNIVTLVFAALYQMNSQKALDHLLYLMNDINMKQLQISSRTLSFALMLPLNMKKPDVALDIMYSPSCEKLMGKKDQKINFKLLALIQLGRLEEPVEILERLRRVFSFEGELLIFSETIDELEEAIKKTGDLDLNHKFSKLKPALYRAGLVYPQRFHDYVTGRVYHQRFRTSFANTKHNYSPGGSRRGNEQGDFR